ncbi:MAG TPA: hypothetical protein VIG37_11095, partial [Methylomirabilota bacterium]
MSARRPRCTALLVWLATVCLIVPGGLATASGVAALTAAELGVVVNVADPKSVEIAEYYARRREIPRENVVPITLPVGQGQITRQEFESAEAELDAHLPAAVQALALA